MATPIMVFADNQEGSQAMSHYKHLNIEERESIYLLHEMGKSIRYIATQLQRSPSTISRELRRGHDKKHSYRPSTAQARYRKRRKNSGRKRILSDAAKRERVRDFILNKRWSPEQIENRLKLENNSFQISYATIYRAVYDGLFSGVKYNKHDYMRKSERFSIYLRKKGKKRKKTNAEQRRGKFQISHHITERPIEAENRLQIGHWEADTVAGKKGSACLLTLTDRRSRYLLAAMIQSKSTAAVNEKLIELLGTLPETAVRSITPDRGCEFAKYETVSASLHNVVFYFPPPYSPWARGTNENTNGLIREFLPKHTTMEGIPEDYVSAFVDSMNMRPRKCLGWRSPAEIFFNKVLHLT